VTDRGRKLVEGTRPEDGAPDESRESQPQEAGVQCNRRESGEPGQPDGPEGTSGRRKPDAWPAEEPEEERKAQAGRLNRRKRRRTRRSAQAERVGRRKAGDEIHSRCARTHALRIQGTLLCLLSYRPVKRQAAREASLEFAPVANGRLPVSNIAGCLLLDGEAPFDEHIVRDHVKASACEYRWKV